PSALRYSQSQLAGVFQEIIKRFGFAKIAVGMCQSQNWCWSSIASMKLSGIVQATMSPHEISKEKIHCICHKQKCITAHVRWDKALCCAILMKSKTSPFV